MTDDTICMQNLARISQAGHFLHSEGSVSQGPWRLTLGSSQAPAL